MRIGVNNGQMVTVSGVSGQAALSTQGNKMRLAFWAEQMKPEFKPGFKFELGGNEWVVLEVVKPKTGPMVASLQPVGKD